MSIGHFGESHLAPFRKSLVFSRRHSLQSGPVYRAICRYLLGWARGIKTVAQSDPAPLRRPAAIARYGGHILDRADLEPGRLQRPDGGLPARARALDEDVDLAHAVFHRAARGGLRRHLGGVRR